MRGALARKAVKPLRASKLKQREIDIAVVKIQSMTRGGMVRRRIRRHTSRWGESVQEVRGRCAIS